MSADAPIGPPRAFERVYTALRRPKAEFCGRLSLGMTALSLALAFGDSGMAWTVLAGLAVSAALSAVVFRFRETPRPVVVRETVLPPQNVIH